MRVIDASSWEKRNFGCNAWEIELDLSDVANIDSILAMLNSRECGDSYIVVKLPVHELRLAHAIEDVGFAFMEAQLNISGDLTRYETPQAFKRFDGYLKYYVVDRKSDEWVEVADEIGEEMFISDRVYLDPLLPSGTSAKRYRNWVMDLRKDTKTEMLAVRNSRTGKLEGFDMISVADCVGRAKVGGMFNNRPPLGFLHLDVLFKSLISMGAKTFETSISSNNLPMIRCYSQVGCVITNASYVFRRFKR